MSSRIIRCRLANGRDIFDSMRSAFRLSVSMRTCSMGVRGDGLGDFQLAERRSRVLLVRQAQAADELIGERLLLVSAGRAHAGRQRARLLLDGVPVPE